MTKHSVPNDGGTIEQPTGKEAGADKIMGDACDLVAPVDPSDPKNSLMLSVYYDRDSDALSGVNAFKGPTSMLIDACDVFAQIVNHVLTTDNTGLKVNVVVDQDGEHICPSCAQKS